MHYIGVDQAPVEPSSADTCGINRSHVRSGLELCGCLDIYRTSLPLRPYSDVLPAVC